jgi:hypothetical protein
MAIMTFRSKWVFVPVLAVVAAVGAWFSLREPSPLAALPEAKAKSAEASESPRALRQEPPLHDAPRIEERKVSSTSDPFEFIRGLARSAYEGDGRAQFLVSRELDRCEMTLSLVRKESDPEGSIWARPTWSQTMKERDIAEYRRCVRLMKEDPFADLPPRNGGYTFQYWMQRSVQAGYPMAVAERSLTDLLRTPGDATVAANLRTVSLDKLSKAAVSGEPDVALTIGFRNFGAEDAARNTSGAAWMLAACRMGADCDSNSKIFPFWMCEDPDFPNCARDGNVELAMSASLKPGQYAEAYAQSQGVEEALRSRDEATIRTLLEKLSN